MTAYDVFNGDADGICALVQLRQVEPREAQLVTGVKRDINLLKRVSANPADRLTVLDISLDKNREDLQRLLEEGAEVFYCDHHYAGDIPDHAALQTLINPAPEVCTSLLINGHLKGARAAWAVVGAFGDNLRESARRAASPLGLDEALLARYEDLGIYINYNGYGSALEDLHFRPEELYRLLLPHADPRSFMEDGREHFQRLEQGYQADMAAAASLAALHATDHAAVFLLPDEPWARRVSGVYSNDLANANPGRAHAVVTHRASGNYQVSVRAPLENRVGADELCRQFPTGGGRSAAAGINELPPESLQDFVDALLRFYR